MSDASGPILRAWESKDVIESMTCVIAPMRPSLRQSVFNDIVAQGIEGQATFQIGNMSAKATLLAPPGRAQDFTSTDDWWAAQLYHPWWQMSRVLLYCHSVVCTNLVVEGQPRRDLEWMVVFAVPHGDSGQEAPQDIFAMPGPKLMIQRAEKAGLEASRIFFRTPGSKNEGAMKKCLRQGKCLHQTVPFCFETIVGMDGGSTSDFRAVHQTMTHCGTYIVKLVKEEGMPAVSEERIEELEQNQMMVNEAVARQEIEAAQEAEDESEEEDEAPDVD